MGEWLLPRRDGAIVAWHEVLGKCALPPRSRPVGDGPISGRGVHFDSAIEVLA